MSLTRNPYHIREYDLKQMHCLVKHAFDQFDIQGICGNEKVMSYYDANKLAVERFRKFDILRLEKRLPAFFFKLPYNILNNLNRLLLNKEQADEGGLTPSDFHTTAAHDKCLDWLVVAEKPA